MSVELTAKFVVSMPGAPPESDTDYRHTSKYPGVCPKCSFALPPLDECAPVYFVQGYVACAHCANTVDVWVAALANIRAIPGMAWALTAAGASCTSFSCHIEAGKFHTIELTEYGIPADARILATSYTPQGGGVFPIEWHSNSPRRRIIGTTLRLIGHAMHGWGPSS